MPLNEIRKLGDPILYEVCSPVLREEVAALQPIIDQMARLVLAFRSAYGAGRAIAAPQVGIAKRLIVLNIEHPIAIINPILYDKSEKMMELWDDCMSFPNLLVRLERHYSLKMDFVDQHWQAHTWKLEGDLSELMQHEYDHLDGVLATMRALYATAFNWR
ncbi:MAG: peptide deformylase [Bacteroidota bacterium]